MRELRNMEENSLEEVAKTLQEVILQKENEQFKITPESLKTTLEYQDEYQNKCSENPSGKIAE